MAAKCDDEPTLSDIANQLIMDYHLKTRLDSKDTYYYDTDRGVYKNAETFIEQICQVRFDEDDINTKTIEEIKAIIKRKTYTDPSKFVSSPNILNLANGLLNLEECKLLSDGSLDLEHIELLPHSPDVITTVQLPVIFDKNAKCPNTTAFLKEVLSPEDIPLTDEIAGWFLWSEYSVHKAIMLCGNGRNGKGALLRVWQALLDDANCSHISLQRLVDDRFAASGLVDKAVNIYGDLPKRDLSETDVFKCVTGGDTIYVERKFGHPFALTNQAKLAFSTNNLPKSVDDSEGFYSRWIIIMFNQKFGTTEKPIDSNLDEKLHTQEELSGYLNVALKGLTRLRSKNWLFSYTKTLEDVTAMYKRLSDPVYAFLEDCYEYSSDGIITKRELFKHYSEYAKNHNLPPISVSKFGRCMIDQGNISVEEVKTGSVGNQSKAWLGLKKKSSRRSIMDDIIQFEKAAA